MDQHADPAVRSSGGTLRPAPIEGMNSLRVDADETDSSLRWVLHAATQDVHDRLHHHARFASIQDATIGLADYQDLIVRLLGSMCRSRPPRPSNLTVLTGSRATWRPWA